MNQIKHPCQGCWKFQELNGEMTCMDLISWGGEPPANPECHQSIHTEMLIRAVPNYGFLPIVRAYNPDTGEAGKEYYRGEFHQTPVKAAFFGYRHMIGQESCD